MIPNPFRSPLFAFEGMDGNGKSEQVQRFVQWLHSKKINARIAKEPGKDRMYGQMIYRDLNTPGGLHATDPIRFQRLYAADSKQNLVDHIIPILSTKNAACVADRFRPSFVYGAQSPADFPELMRINEAILGEHFIWPDKIFIFDVEPKTAIERLKLKGRALDGYEQISKLELVKQNYLEFARMYPNCVVINADRDPEEIAEEVRRSAGWILGQKR